MLSHTVGLEPCTLRLNTDKWMKNHHPTQWAWNIWQILPKSIWRTSSRHPTRWARNFVVISLFCLALSVRRHPTRWARNGEVKVYSEFQVEKSPSHTVGSEPQTTTLNKIRHINNFVKGAPLSNEVNFPKSEIMQS